MVLRLNYFVTTAVVLFIYFVLPAPTPIQDSVSAPVLVSPAEGAIVDNGCRDQSDSIDWEFDWEDVWGADQYHIKVWHNPEKPVADDMNVKPSDYKHVSRASHIIESNRKGWCWTVRAKVGRRWGDWAEVRCFEAEPLNTDCP